MNTILLRPTDVLFFRDGRPMTGSLAGHGAAWPMPNVINAAFHAALHRAELDADGSQELHTHRRGARGVYAEDAERNRKFGSLLTAGPYPVRNRDAWFFPRPHDLQDLTLQPALQPTMLFDPVHSSLPDPPEYAVANRLPPGKESAAKPWLSKEAYEIYLGTADADVTVAQLADPAVADSDLFDGEHTIGIAIDPDTGSTGQGEAAGQIYSAHYLRLRDEWQLGVCAAAVDKKFNHPPHGNDLVQALLKGGKHQIIVGGQQRICSASLVKTGGNLPLPRGKTERFHDQDGKFLVKWALLSPAIWPALKADSARNINHHPGGWLPNWIDSQTGEVLLKAGDTARHELEGRDAWRRRVRQLSGIRAKLVAATVPKPLVVTGWSLPDETGGTEAERNGGAQSTQLAVPAGAVYYFEAGSADEACELAAALNWHGSGSNLAAIRNRRSTLLGEKGFGLGVCGTWQFHEDVGGRPGD
jgi:CRISPR-associated protein Cmr3